MKAEELMIEDWVLYNKQPHKVRQLGIYGTDRDGNDYPAVCVGKPNGIGLILERNEIEPIPLTPEILEKNGFVGKEFYSELIVGDFRILCDVHNVCVYHNEHVDLDIPIEYLHELQQAMRLCGISKQIEL